MKPILNLALVLHSHQPVGNFDFVIEDAFKTCYQPFIDVFDSQPEIKVSLHFSGCLLEWIEAHHPDYFDKLRAGVLRGQYEMVGGAMYEPILTMLPERDRAGQLGMMRDYIESKFYMAPSGMWLAERIWEQALVSTIASAGYDACCLDDSHFKNAGFADHDLTGGFVAEDQGNALRVFPGSEKLRYMVPFHYVDEIINYLRSEADETGTKTVIYADDGEKFGVWPGTNQLCFDNGWLKTFLRALYDNRDWLNVITLSEAAKLPAAGQAYLPDASYREMGEWALPAKRLSELKQAQHTIESNPQTASAYQKIRGQIRGGSWRNFRVRYPEARRMYAKMLHVSEQLRIATDTRAASSAVINEARADAYRGQCNCPYWHGVFGGLYLPHLRYGVQSALIRAQNRLESLDGPERLIRQVADFDRDGRDELYLSNDHLGLYIAPHRGCRLYQFDVRSVQMNMIDTLARRYEEYHDRVSLAVVAKKPDEHKKDELASDEKESENESEKKSIHDLIIAKEAGLEKLLYYDEGPRESLADHLFKRLPTPDELFRSESRGHPAFLNGEYKLIDCLADDNDSLIVARFEREADASGVCRVRIEKSVTLYRSGEFARSFFASYKIVNTGLGNMDAWFGIENNYALMAGNAHDRYYRHDGCVNAGPLKTVADFGSRKWLELRDEYNNIALRLKYDNSPDCVQVFPVLTVSQSEGGFESVYQSSATFSFYRLKLAPGAVRLISFVQETGPCQ